MKRMVSLLNTDWLYCPEDKPSFARTACAEKRFQTVSLPHTNVELPYHDFDDAEYQFVSWYRKHLAVPRAMRGRRVYLDFDGVMMAAEVFVNGTKVCSHKGGYVPFAVDVTDHVTFGARPTNVVAVRVDSTERKDIPPCGGTVDYLTFGGIYRDVRLRAVNPFHIDNVFAKPGDVTKKRKRLTVAVTLANRSDDTATGVLHVELLDAQGTCVAAADSPDVSVPAGAVESAEIHLTRLDDIRLWQPDTPNLYTVRVTLRRGASALDSVDTRFGFRHVVFTSAGPFKLNGKVLKLRGLNRHQTFPFIGAAVPARLQRLDADILKHELGLNIARTSHYPQSPHFLDCCDEIGLMVYEEIPGWNFIGGPAWKRVACNDLRGMIVRDRNHPSIVLWGVRINESRDDHDFYTETNRIAHELDDTRQTGGIRCGPLSEMLEDVYTFNDFIHTGGDQVIRDPRVITGLDRDVPYMVTEFNGHMYPTKSFDQEERLVEHALRHARVQNAIAGHPGIAGGIGWCAFDYNTHHNFGSGDRVCYHGVSDIWRFPKFAAFFYESQIDPAQRPVLRVASRWKIGERAGGGVEPLTVFSNCDRIEVRFGKGRRTYRPDRKQFPHLPHPPFVCYGIHGLWGGRWEDLQVIGYVKGKNVAETRVAADGVPRALFCWADHTELDADGADMTRIAFALTDRYGNVLPYATGAVQLSVTGPATLVGPNPFPLVGGVGAVYLRAGHRLGVVKVAAAAPRLPSQTVSVRIRKA